MSKRKTSVKWQRRRLVRWLLTDEPAQERLLHQRTQTPNPSLVAGDVPDQS